MEPDSCTDNEMRGLNEQCPRPRGWFSNASTKAAKWIAPKILRFLPWPLQQSGRGSPYKDSTQIGIKCTGIFSPDSFLGEGVSCIFAKEGSESKRLPLKSGKELTAQVKAEFKQGWDLVSIAPAIPLRNLPTVHGLQRVYASFKPTRAILTEILIATFGGKKVPNVSRAAIVESASDLVLVQAFCGAINCFPNAPSEDAGISGAAFGATSLGNGVDWPTINGGIDMSVAFAIEPTVLYQIAPPDGFTTDDIISIEVRARFSLLGPQLR